MGALLSGEPLSKQARVTLSHPLTVALALAEGVGGALLTRISDSPLLSERSRALLTEAQLRETWLEEARLQALAARWPSTLPAPLLIKGASYSPRLLGREALWGSAERASSDLDLLIPTPWHEARHALTPLLRTPGLIARYKEARDACVALSLNGLLIECHHALAPPTLWPHEGELSARVMWRRGKEVQLKVGRETLAVRVPTQEDQLVIALVQLLKGGGGWRLREWLDLSRMLIKCPEALLSQVDGEAWRAVGLDQAASLALYQLKGTVAWGLLPEPIRASRPLRTPPQATWSQPALSGVTPTLLERVYTRAWLLSARPTGATLLQ